jgi:predicted phosphodiesterase
MKIGLIADIHEHVEHLRTALDLFYRENVDQIIVLGDVFEMAERIEETCQLLAEVKAIGVWGNHDFGLCVNPDDGIRARYPASVLDYLATLRPQLDIDDCHFTHVEPWLNPNNLADLWYFEGPPDQHGKLGRIFNAVSNRIMFVGHYHVWLAATPKGFIEWAGESPICLDQDRYFVVIGALCDGSFAIFDTATSMLTPFNEKWRFPLG